MVDDHDARLIDGIEEALRLARKHDRAGRVETGVVARDPEQGPRGDSSRVERSLDVGAVPERSAVASSPSRRRARKESSPWRRKTIRVGADDELGVATLIELHSAVAVGAICGHLAERRERLGGGMTIPVLSANGDHCGAWSNRVDERRGVRARSPVVRRDVDARREGSRSEQ